MKRKFWYVAVVIARWLRNRSGEWHTTTRNILIWIENHYLDTVYSDAIKAVKRETRGEN